jgi:hypothetical protein
VTVPLHLDVDEPPGPDPGGAVEILFSSHANRSGALPLEGALVTGVIYAFTSPDNGVDRVDFYLDDPGLDDRFQRENNAPYDVRGTNSNGTARGWSSESLSEGVHVLSADVRFYDGSSNLVEASFAVGNPSPSLSASPRSLSLSAAPGQTLTRTVAVVSDGPATPLSLSSDVPWLSAVANGSTPATVTLSIDAPTAVGDYDGTVSVTAPGCTPDAIGVGLEVLDDTPTPQLAFGAPSLVFALDQDAASSSKTVGLDSSVGAASFDIDLPAGANWLSVAPQSGATPRNLVVTADPAGLASGAYAGTIAATAPGHLGATLDVTLVVQGSYTLSRSAQRDRSNPLPLDGAELSGDVAIFSFPDTPDIESVDFYLDGGYVGREGNPPYDFDGGSTTLANLWDSTEVGDGPHRVRADLHLDDGSTVTVNASFAVLNEE